MTPLENQMLHLDLEDRRRGNAALVVTPPAEGELNTATASKSSVLVPTRPIDSSLMRIYRRTPTPTVLLDGSLRVVETSESHETLLHHSREDLLGTSIYELPPRLVPAPDVAALSGILATAISTREAQTLDPVRVADFDRSFSLRVTPIFEHDALIYLLLEAQAYPQNNSPKRPESIIHEQTYLNETYKMLVDTARDYAIFMIDCRGHIVTWNSGAAILKGYSRDEIIGQHFSIFYGHEDREADKPGRELVVCLREGKVEDEGWRYRKDGTRFWANVMITAIYQLGRHVGFVKVTRDLTERKAAEARLIDAFEEASKIKTDFLANMSHELRTPMNGMSLALTMLMRTSLNSDQKEYASVLEDSTSILLQVINDVLDYSKLSSGSFSLTTDVLDVPSVVSAVMRNCQPSLKSGVALEKSVAPKFPLNIKGDPLRFRQILQNLVGNSVKFTEKGYVHIKASYKEVENHCPPCYIITVEVIDSGIGVPEDAINTLFNPFSRFADSATRRYQGTGLGLSICKSLAELMGGEIGFHANPDGPGSVFWMSTKMHRLESTLASQARRNVMPVEPAAQLFDATEPLSKVAPLKQVLLVEDNKVNQTIMIKLLASLGFQQVDAAWDGAEAVRMVKQKPLAYNVILMDINMPVMNGLTATEHIRKVNVDVPIIALTGNALKGDAETYLAKGMNDYIAKPLYRQQLVDLLWKWCGS